MQKKLTVLFAFAIFVLVVGWTVTPVQAHVGPMGQCLHKDEFHKHCDDDPTPTDPEPIIEDCSVDLCIADVGLKGTAPDDGGRPADLYAREENNRSITNISSPKFNKILKALTEGVLDAQDLCDAYHVLIFNWGSPTIKDLNWQQLIDYMNCFGGIIFEDQNNVEALAPDVSTIEIDRHGGGQSPLSLTFVSVPILTDGFDDPNDPTADFANQHIIFAEPNPDTNTNVGLTSFLSLTNGGGDVVGLYGEFGNGRIVLTGPDNNYHGLLNSINDEIKANHTDLLFNEINWVLDQGP